MSKLFVRVVPFMVLREVAGAILNGFRKGQNITHVKSKNLSTVLETIIRLEPISRIAISSLTGLTLLDNN